MNEFEGILKTFAFPCELNTAQRFAESSAFRRRNVGGGYGFTKLI